MTSRARPRRRLPPPAVARGEAARPVLDCADRVVGARSLAGWGRCPRRRLARSRYLPWISEHVAGGRASFRDVPRLAASQVRCRHRIPVIARLPEVPLGPARFRGSARSPRSGQASSTRASDGCNEPDEALQTDTGPDIRQLLHLTTGGAMPAAATTTRVSAAERLRAQMEGSHALASQVTGWMLATQGRLGMSGQARASLAALKEQEARSGEVHNAEAVICHRGPNARPVCDPDPRPSRRHGAVGVPRAGVAAARRGHRAYRAAGPVGPVWRAGRDRGARPGPGRGPPAHATRQITRIR
jgi:hypothetical protein